MKKLVDYSQGSRLETYYDDEHTSEEAFSEALLGKTITEVLVVTDDEEPVAVRFRLSTGEVLELAHRKECCESVIIESIVGDLRDLVGSPITMADEVSVEDLRVPEAIQAQWDEERKERESVGEHFEEPQSRSWTFYKLATIKGYIDIRFFGSSSGHYSESAELFECE